MNDYIRLQRFTAKLQTLCADYLTEDDIWCNYDAETTEFRCAVHEVGHALMAIARNCPVHHISLISDRINHAVCLYEYHEENHAPMEKVAIVMAGPIAEIFALGGQVDGGHHEIISALRYAYDAKGVDTEALEEMYEEGDGEDMERALESYYDSIQSQFLRGSWAKYFPRLVLALLERKRLENEDLVAILGNVDFADNCSLEIPAKYLTATA